jgi:hypothetical protein
MSKRTTTTTKRATTKRVDRDLVPKSETDLVRQCLALLGESNVIADAWRNNTGVAYLPGKGGKPRPVFFGRRGVSDILGFTAAGRFLAVECKMPKKQATPEQRTFLDDVHRAGGVALVVRSRAELAAALVHLALDPDWSPHRADGVERVVRPCSCPRCRPSGLTSDGMFQGWAREAVEEWDGSSNVDLLRLIASRFGTSLETLIASAEVKGAEE